MPAQNIKLTFASPYLSISSFPNTSLPSFTLITGLNGSGKTHLLKAIGQGLVRAEGIQDYPREVRYLDWNSLVPQDHGVFAPEVLEQERQRLLSIFDVAL